MQLQQRRSALMQQNKLKKERLSEIEKHNAEKRLKAQRKAMRKEIREKRLQRELEREQKSKEAAAAAPPLEALASAAAAGPPEDVLLSLPPQMQTDYMRNKLEVTIQEERARDKQRVKGKKYDG